MKLATLRTGAGTAPRKETGSSVYQVFEGTGEVSAGDQSWQVERGDLFVVPSWQALSVATDGGLDLFRFTDAPILEQLHQYRTQTGETQTGETR